MGCLDNNVCLITGGGSGLGRALVERFVEEGAQIVVLEVAPHKVERLRVDFPDGTVSVVQGDVSSLADNERAVAEALSRFGALDTFVQCAAIADYMPRLRTYPKEHLGDAFDAIFSVNTKGCVFGARACVEALAERRGSMIFTLSTSAFYPGGQGVIYSLSKSANVILVRQLALELEPDVRVNAVVPGGIKGSDIRGPGVLGHENLTPVIAMPAIAEVLAGAPAPAEYAGIYTLLADKKDAARATGSIIFWNTGGMVGHGPGLLDLVNSVPLSDLPDS
jgi:NAD(P)-dependent dehydrogenase (short-subunit alcohol dehydrogenase family)